MKIWMQPIEMIAFFDAKGSPRPLRYRWESPLNFGDNGLHVIKVDRIIEYREEKLAGNRMIVYRCQSMIGDLEKVYELKYEYKTCRWYLYKM